MKHFITKNSTAKCFIFLFWIAVWQILSMIIAQDLLFASPVSVFISLLRNIVTKTFWISIGSSFCKITIGFLIGFMLGILVAFLAYKSKVVEILFSPLISMMKSIPVASFIIVVLIWVKSANLSPFISFFVAFPTFYVNLLEGLQKMDISLLEMLKVFKVSLYKKIRYVYIPLIMSYLISGSRIGLGLSWKAGIAAEVIGLPKNSIGEQLYLSKLYLETSNLFAWTIVIIVVSSIFERVWIRLLVFVQKNLEVK